MLNRTPTNRELLRALFSRNLILKKPIRDAAKDVSLIVSFSLNIPDWKIKSHLMGLYNNWKGTALTFVSHDLLLIVFLNTKILLYSSTFQEQNQNV